MIEVNRNNIVIRNVDFESQEFKKLNSMFSLYDKVQHKYTFNAFSIIDKDIYLPASIGLNIIQSFYPKKEVEINFKNYSKSRTISYNLIHQPKNELQKNAINFIMKLKSDKEQHSRFLSLATGSGKTYVTINVVSQLKKCPLIIVDTADLAAQWKREFLKHTDLKDDDIIILSGQDSVNKQLKKPTGIVYIAIHRTLTNMLTNDMNSVNALMNKLGIGIRVFDESHVEFGNICKINCLSNVQYTLYLTATPSRSNFNDDSLYGKVFRKIPYFNGKDISDEKYHTVILYDMDTKPGIDVKAGIKTKYGFSQARWAQYISNDGYEIFLETVDGIFKTFSLATRGKKVAIMLPTIELINKLKKDLEDLYPELEIGTFIGAVKKTEREKELKKSVVLTNDKIFDKGIDDSDLEILINFVPFGSLVKTEQMIGRLRYGENKSSILIDIVDNGFDECIRLFKVRRRYYKKKAKKIIIAQQKN